MSSAKTLWSIAPKATKRKLIRHVVKHPIKTYKKAKWLKKKYDAIPAFEVASSGKFNSSGEEYARDNDLPEPEGPELAWLFWPASKPIEYLVNKLPPFSAPPRGVRRPKGETERSWDDVGKADVVIEKEK